MNPLDIIRKKRFGGELNEAEIRAFVSGATDGSFADYQLSALLMAIAINGMTDRETMALALAMAKSGLSIDWRSVGVVGDKHSTGGVGDDTTFICTPVAAACGAKMALMSGRGLAHTGGTLDKFMTIPGYNPYPDIPGFQKTVRECGCSVIGQTDDLTPADRVLYALRDVTETVDCLPLIAASITSKKLACGCDHVILDVKTGNGAMMQNLEDATKLARAMVNIGRLGGKQFAALITDMNQPLGNCAGNALEMKEAIGVLKNEVFGPLRDLSLELAAHSVRMAGIAPDQDAARKMAKEALDSGRALAKYKEMIAAQGGDASIVDETDRMPKASHVTAIRAMSDGYVAGIDTAAIGNGARALGAGRYRTDDEIDLAAGVVIKKRIGDKVRIGDVLMSLEYNDANKRPAAMEILKNVYSISREKVAPPPLIYEEIL